MVQTLTAGRGAERGGSKGFTGLWDAGGGADEVGVEGAESEDLGHGGGGGCVVVGQVKMRSKDGKYTKEKKIQQGVRKS